MKAPQIATTFDQLETTPAIPAGNISRQTFHGIAEISEGVIQFVSITTPDGDFLVAGGACNAGMLPTYAYALDLDCFSLDEHLQEMLADVEEIEAGGIPSGELLRWHGSLVI